MKRLLACLLVLCLALSLCACGKTPTETEPAKTVPAETKSAETEPAKIEPAETEPAETEPAKTEPAETEPAETEPAETVPEWTEPGERIRGGDDLIAPYAELWSHENLDGYVRINPDWTWERLDADGVFVDSGTCSYLDGYGLILEQNDGTDWDYLFIEDNGSIYNSGFMLMTMEELEGPIDYDDNYTLYPYDQPSAKGYSELACQIYEEVYPMVANLEDFSYSSADCDDSYMEALIEASSLIADRHPETRMYFRLDDTFDEQDNRVMYSIYFWDGDANADRDLIREKLDDFENQAAKTAAKVWVKDEMTAYEWYLRLAAVICYNADFGYEEAGAPNSPWAGIMNGTCSDEGYATALQYLCAEANLYCEVVHGYSRDGYHAWNLVKLPSGTYYIDLAWADMAGEPESPEWMAYFMMDHTAILQEYQLLK